MAGSMNGRDEVCVNILVEKSEGKRYRHKEENYITTCLKKLRREVIDWIHWYMTGISGGLL